MKKILQLPLVACAALAIFASGVVHAQTAAYTVTTTGTQTETDLAGYGISGFEFTLQQNINITSLGFTPLSLGGGDTPSVTVWQVNVSNGDLTLVYNTGDILSDVSSQGNGTGNGVPQYVSLSSLGSSPLSLSSGDTYLVSAPAYWAATYSSTNLAVSSGPFSSTSYLTQASGGWNGWPNSGYFASSPNISTLTAANPASTPVEADFLYTAGSSPSVPEPSTYALLLGGMGILWTWVRRSRRSSVR